MAEATFISNHSPPTAPPPLFSSLVSDPEPPRASVSTRPTQSCRPRSNPCCLPRSNPCCRRHPHPTPNHRRLPSTSSPVLSCRYFSIRVRVSLLPPSTRTTARTSLLDPVPSHPPSAASTTSSASPASPTTSNTCARRGGEVRRKDARIFQMRRYRDHGDVGGRGWPAM